MSIKISKNAHLCAACGNDFQHEQTITSTVKKWEGALHRDDFCSDCWHAERNKETYSVWTMVYHDPKLESEEPAEVFSPLRQLFYEAAEEDSRVEMAKAFLAAGLLRRQKVFRLIKESDEAEGNVRVTLYTDRLGNRLIEVPDPQFTYQELETARIRLMERLQELEAAATQEAEPTESAATADAAPVAEMEADESALSTDEEAAADIPEEVADGVDEEEGDDDGEEEYDDDEDDDDDEEYDDDDEDDDDEDYDDDEDDDDEDDDEDDEYEDDDEDDDVEVVAHADNEAADPDALNAESEADEEEVLHAQA